MICYHGGCYEPARWEVTGVRTCAHHLASLVTQRVEGPVTLTPIPRKPQCWVGSCPGEVAWVISDGVGARFLACEGHADRAFQHARASAKVGGTFVRAGEDVRA